MNDEKMRVRTCLPEHLNLYQSTQSVSSIILVFSPRYQTTSEAPGRTFKVLHQVPIFSSTMPFSMGNHRVSAP